MMHVFRRRLYRAEYALKHFDFWYINLPCWVRYEWEHKE